MPRVLSLFSGVGGLDIGFHDAGFDIISCVEIEKIFCETLQKNNSRISNAVIHNMDINDFIKKPELWPRKIDFIIGGPPCQPFSAGGRRAGGAPGVIDEVRGTLYEPYSKLVDELRPKGFLFENVKGILNSNKGDDWARIKSTFNSLGYSLYHQILDTAEYGVPQHRERVFLIGVENRELEFKWPSSTHGPYGKSDYVSAEMAISNLDISNEDTEIKGKYADLIPGIPNGGNYSHYTVNKGHKNPLFGWRSRFSGFLYKASPQHPVKTLLANPGGWGGPFHWENRKMKISELKRLQTIPDEWEICGSRNKQIRQIGNSVPPRIAFILAQAILVQLFDVKGINIELSESLSSDRSSRKARIASQTRLSTTKPRDIEAKILSLKNKQFRKISITSEDYYDALSITESLDGIPLKEFDFMSYGEIFTLDFSIDGCLRLFISDDFNQHFNSDSSVKMKIFLANPLQINKKEIVILEIFTSNRIRNPIILSWDVFNQLIKKYTSFPSLMQFYGHFTEPHPQFRFEFENLGIIEDWDAKLQIKLSREWKLNKNIEINELSFLFANPPKEIIQNLIKNRVDIRTNDTNAQIPKDFFRICYPFPLPVGTVTSIPNTPSIRRKF